MHPLKILFMSTNRKKKIIYTYRNLYIYIYISEAIGLMSRVFANGPWNQGSIPGQVITKNQKMIHGAALLNTQHYKVWIKGNVEIFREWTSTLFMHFCLKNKKFRNGIQFLVLKTNTYILLSWFVLNKIAMHWALFLWIFTVIIFWRLYIYIYIYIYMHTHIDSSVCVYNI